MEHGNGTKMTPAELAVLLDTPINEHDTVGSAFIEGHGIVTAPENFGDCVDVYIDSEIERIADMVCDTTAFGDAVCEVFKDIDWSDFDIPTERDIDEIATNAIAEFVDSGEFADGIQGIVDSWLCEHETLSVLSTTINSVIDDRMPSGFIGRLRWLFTGKV